MNQRPNILLIMTDQQQSAAMSCAGNAYMKTPALDSLAENGIRFETAYSTHPACTPSRASIFTGRVPHEVGALRFGDPIDERFRDVELGNLLSDAGYDCAYGGKWHANNITMDEGHGFANICGHNDNDLPPACIDYLNQEHDKPFFLVASFLNPHNICEWSNEMPLPAGKIDVPGDERACPPLPNNHSAITYEPYLLRLWRKHFDAFDLDLTPSQWRQYIYAYYRLIEKADRGIQQVLDALRASPFADNTLIVFTSDHGDQAGSHMLHQKGVLYDESLRVPFILAGPMVQPKGTVDSDHLVSMNPDLFATLCDYAEVDLPEGVSGSSLRPLAEKRSDDYRPHDYVAAEECFTFLEKAINIVNPQARMIRTQDFKYVVHSKGPYCEQLFDMRTDSGETTNLATCSDHHDILEQHRHLLREWVNSTNDSFVIPAASQKDGASGISGDFSIE